jgi:hypothetical protein
MTPRNPHPARAWATIEAAGTNEATMSNAAAVARELGFAAAQALYLFSPLLVSAAIAAVVMHFDVWPWLYRPIDGGCLVGGKRLFGDHKTWRGVVVVVAGSIATVVIQKTVDVRSVAHISVVDYDSIDAVSFGAAMGVGAALGELHDRALATAEIGAV